MKKIFYYLTLCLCTSFTFSSCSDDDDDEDLAPTTEQLLMSDKQWQVTAASATILGIPQNVYATQMEECQRDNLYKFMNNQVLLMDEGLTRCNSDDPQQVATTWALEGDTITLDGSMFGLPISEIDFVIEDITANKLDLSFSDNSFGSVTGTATLTVK